MHHFQLQPPATTTSAFQVGVRDQQVDSPLMGSIGQADLDGAATKRKNHHGSVALPASAANTNEADVDTTTQPSGPLAMSDDELASLEATASELESELLAGDQPNATYQPAVTAIHSFTRGYAQLVPGVVSGRLHEFLSRPKLHAFLAYDWKFDEYCNIRESLPLPVELTVAVAKRDDLIHPRNQMEGKPAVLTVDLLVTKRSGGWIGVSYRSADDAAKGGAETRLTLIERTLAIVGVPLVRMDDRDLPKVLVRNLRWLRVHQLPFDRPPLTESQLAAVEPPLRAVLAGGRTTVFRAAQSVAAAAGLDAASVARAAYRLVATGCWRVDLHKPVGPDYPLHFV